MASVCSLNEVWRLIAATQAARRWVPLPAIASLSLGEERVFLLKHKTRKDLPTQKLLLPSGSLLLMQGKTQQHWRHGIAKQRRHCDARINLTFRKIVSDIQLRGKK